jgi:hypothetical protein
VSPRIRGLVLRLGGAMLVALGMLHLAVTPIIHTFISQNVPSANVEWFAPPMLLNHVVVGILLIPLGILTYYGASSAVNGERWAMVIVRTSTVSVALLPVTLFLVMGTRYFNAVPFVVATFIVCIVSIVLLVAAFWPQKASAA